MKPTPRSIRVALGHPGPEPQRPANANAATATQPNPADSQAFVQTPVIDIYESSEGLVLEADLPGVREQDVNIHLEDNVLRLDAPVVAETPEGARLLHQEYRSGRFQRQFILSDEVDRQAIGAELRDGVLRLVLPKAERARTRRIEIKSGS
jgi:HSP20 family molecular chaperone IbpA